MSTHSFERLKYEKMWNEDKYRKFSPGEKSVYDFITHKPKGRTLVDIGCGTGRASKKLSEHFEVCMFDIAKNAPEVDLPFVCGCIWKDEIPEADWGYCCDVMEHIPPSKINKTLENIAKSTSQIYFRIYFQDDKCGKEVGETLHLTVKPFEWWDKKIKQYFNVKDSKGDTLLGIWLCTDSEI